MEAEARGPLVRAIHSGSAAGARPYPGEEVPPDVLGEHQQAKAGSVLQQAVGEDAERARLGWPFAPAVAEARDEVAGQQDVLVPLWAAVLHPCRGAAAAADPKELVLDAEPPVQQELPGARAMLARQAAQAHRAGPQQRGRLPGSEALMAAAVDVAELLALALVPQALPIAPQVAPEMWAATEAAKSARAGQPDGPEHDSRLAGGAALPGVALDGPLPGLQALPAGLAVPQLQAPLAEPQPSLHAERQAQAWPSPREQEAAQAQVMRQ